MMTSERCYRCAHADFKTPAQSGMKAFCLCRVEEPFRKFTYKPSCHECDTGKFQMAKPETMERRKVFFESLGQKIDEELKGSEKK